jgi:hypothetical protein
VVTPPVGAVVTLRVVVVALPAVAGVVPVVVWPAVAGVVPESEVWPAVAGAVAAVPVAPAAPALPAPAVCAYAHVPPNNKIKKSVFRMTSSAVETDGCSQFLGRFEV